MKDEQLHYRILFFGLVTGVIILFLNDHFWKYQYANTLTGKLSDFVGLLVFPIVIGILFPGTRRVITSLVAAMFIVWKTPIVDPAIDLWNSLLPLKVIRTIDYSDYWALLVLPLAHTILIQLNVEQFRIFWQKRAHPLITNLLVLFSAITFCATSIQEPFYPKGDILINTTFTVKNKTSSEVLTSLQESLAIKEDSISYDRYGNIGTYGKYYQIEQLVLPGHHHNQQDTVSKLNFRLFENEKSCEFEIINLSVKNNWHLQHWKNLKHKTKEYQQAIQPAIIKLLSPDPS